MNETEYYANEFSDSELDNQADSGDKILDYTAFAFRVSNFEILWILLEGDIILDAERAKMRALKNINPAIQIKDMFLL